MTKQEAKEQRRKAKRLARVLNGLPGKSFIYNNSLSVPGDGVMAVEISIDWNGKWYTASGAAKCNRADVWSEGLGVDIATGRALLRVAYQILKEENFQNLMEKAALVKDINEAFREFQTLLGVKIFEDKSSEVPGSAKYRSVIQPEVIPTGLEVMKEKGMLNEQEQSPSSPSEG